MPDGTPTDMPLASPANGIASNRLDGLPFHLLGRDDLRHQSRTGQTAGDRLGRRTPAHHAVRNLSPGTAPGERLRELGLSPSGARRGC